MYFARARSVLWSVLVLAGWAASSARADYYVAPPPAGSDQNPGTKASPFATIARAQTAAMPGDTVFFRAGTYTFASSTAADGIVLSKSGTAGNPISYFAYPGETPVFDFSGMSMQARITGFRVTASYLHFKGLELKGVPQNITTANESWCIYNTGGNHNVYEQLDLHDNQGPGLFIIHGGDNLVLNCDSHDNYDPKSASGDGSNADGFGAHIAAGDTGNVFRGCRAWSNSDDGFDLIQAQEPVTIESSWAWSNGYLPGTTTPKGNGNGFKAGGYGLPATNVPANPPKHTVRLCVAFSNRAAGFYANHHPVADDWFNNSAYKNAPDFNMLGLNGNVGHLRNNLAYGGTLLSNTSGVDDATNSWSLSVTVDDGDFESVSTSGMDGPRGADGSLPVLPFLHLKAASDLIDRGEDVGLPFAGKAPDLGAFELGLMMSTGSGGASGGGGNGTGGNGAGGATGTQASGGAGSAATSVAGMTGTAGRGVAASGGQAVQTSAGTSAASAGRTSGNGNFVASAGSAAGTAVEVAGSGSSSASSSGGCSCRTTSSSRSPAAVPLALGLLVALSGRRTRRAGRHASNAREPSSSR